MKQFNTITSLIDAGLITSTVITGGVSIAAFASDIGLSVGIALSVSSLLFSPVIKWKSFKIFIIKQERHNAVKLLAQRRLDSLADIISQPMQDWGISSNETQKLLQEAEKCRKFKTDIRNQSKTKIK